MAQKNSGENPAPNINYNILRSSAVLLFMEYKPSELARELRINAKTILRSYIPAGLPHRRDQNGNIWIVGTTFDEWARSIHHQKAFVKKTRLRDDQAYCVKCRRVIEYQTVIKRRVLSAGRIMLFISCPHCGITLTRFLKGRQND
jgi:hypothetical protein